MLTEKSQQVAVIGAGIAGTACTPQAQRVAPAESCWWDAGQGLGVCGDFLGNSGVEGASPLRALPRQGRRSGGWLPAVRRQAGGGRGLVQRLGEEGVNMLAGHQASR